MNLRTATLVLTLAACGIPQKPRVIAPRPDDVASIDGIMRAFYEVVNVGPDEPRQWDRDRTLYSPWVRFVSIGKGRDIWTHPEFTAATEPLIQGGFREREIHRTTRTYGNIVHIDSTYETKVGTREPFQLSRGVNSIELYFDGKRWWIASVMWQSETPEHPIPTELLPPPSTTSSRASIPRRPAIP